ncbi:hypothetical protein JST99_04610 [Candidatus Dependentiae bacterium]|nr:hypothetical protein [Candidatus Dependentiae bacterium]
MRQAKKAVKVIAYRNGKEKKAMDQQREILLSALLATQIENIDLKASIQAQENQENLAKKELSGKAAENSSSSKVRLDWRELPEAEDDAPELQRGDKGCWWEPAINRRRWWE